MAVGDVAGGIEKVYGTDGTANINAGLGYAVLAFTNMENLGNIMDGNEGATNADDSVETYYGMSGVKNLVGTKGNDTFSWGRGFMVDGASANTIVGAFWNTRNNIWDGGTVDMGEGDDTYLFQLTTSGYGTTIYQSGTLTSTNMRVAITGVDNTNKIEAVDILGVENLILDDYSVNHEKLPGYDRLYDGTTTILTVDTSLVIDSTNHVLDLGGGRASSVTFNNELYTKMDNRISIDLSGIDDFVPVNNASTSSGIKSATAYQIGSLTVYNAMEWQFTKYNNESDKYNGNLGAGSDRGVIDWSNRQLEAAAYDKTIHFFSAQSQTFKCNINIYADVNVNYVFDSIVSATETGDAGTIYIKFNFVDISNLATGQSFIMGMRVDDLDDGDNAHFAVRDPNDKIKASYHQGGGEIAWFSVYDVLTTGISRSGPDDYAARALNMEDEKIAKDESKDESNDNNKKDESSEPDIEFNGNGQMEADFFGRGSTNKGNQNNTNPDNTTDNEAGANEESPIFESNSSNNFSHSKSVDDLTYVNSKPLSNASNLDLSLKLEEAELDLSNLMQLIEETPTTDVSQLDAVNEDMGNLPENLLELTNTIDASDSMSYALEDGVSSIESSNQEVVAVHDTKHKLYH